jgi:hypothetical protein
VARAAAADPAAPGAPEGRGGASGAAPAPGDGPPCGRGAVVVDSEPPGARILLGPDHRDTGRITPCTLDGLAAGVIEIHLALDGHPPASRSVRIQPGGLSYLKLPLGRATRA